MAVGFGLDVWSWILDVHVVAMCSVFAWDKGGVFAYCLVHGVSAVVWNGLLLHVGSRSVEGFDRARLLLVCFARTDLKHLFRMRR